MILDNLKVGGTRLFLVEGKNLMSCSFVTRVALVFAF